jgi:hypothetical protein
MNNPKIRQRRTGARSARGLPTCHLPAEVTDRFTPHGVSGPVEHVKFVCIRRHRYSLPVDMLHLSATVSGHASAPPNNSSQITPLIQDQ